MPAVKIIHLWQPLGTWTMYISSYISAFPFGKKGKKVEQSAALGMVCTWSCKQNKFHLLHRICHSVPVSNSLFLFLVTMSCHTSPSSSIPCWPGYRFLNSVGCDNRSATRNLPRQIKGAKLYYARVEVPSQRLVWNPSLRRKTLPQWTRRRYTISPDPPICNPCCQGTEAFSERQNQAISGKPASWHSAKTLDINAWANDFRCSGLSPCSVWQCWMRLHAHEIP